jgi:tRNA-modifying protein YgfZ
VSLAAYTGGVDAVALRPRSFVRVAGPDAEDYLQRMLSNDVAALAPGESCEALLLTPKARVIAPMRALRRAPDDFLLLTEPELGETLRDHLVRMRFAAKADIELEEHTSTLVFGDDVEGIPNHDYGGAAVEALDVALEPTLDEDALEAMRIEAGTPRFGKEIDDRVLPAEAGLVERAVSLTKGCYPGQEPIARLHYRGHANRGLRVLAVEGEELPEPDAELSFGEKVVGRVTSAARSNGRIVALAYVRAEVAPDAVLAVGRSKARPLH